MDRPEILIRCRTKYKRHRHGTWGHDTCFLKVWGCRLAMAQGKRRHLLWQPPWPGTDSVQAKPSCGRRGPFLATNVKSIFHGSLQLYVCAPLPDANLCGLTETMPSRHVLVSNVGPLGSHQLGFHGTHCTELCL